MAAGRRHELAELGGAAAEAGPIRTLCETQDLASLKRAYDTVQPSGKAVKRAYSMLTLEAEHSRFQIAVKRIPGGPGSGFIHALEAGATLRFSGPWGRFFPHNGLTGPTLVLATDTGITAALGLVQGAGFQALAAEAIVIWLRTTPDYFLPETLVRERVPPACRELCIAATPPIGDPERIAQARAILHEVLGSVVIRQAFVWGDEAVNYALLDDLVAAGARPPRTI